LNPPPEARQGLREAGVELVLNPHHQVLTEEDLLALLPGFDAVIAGPEPYSDSVISTASPRLRIIARTGVGYDKVDVASASRNGVFVTWTPIPELSSSVADLAIALILALVKKVPRLNAEVRMGKWDRQKWSDEVGDLRGKTLGLLGMGRIGGEVAVRARAFGMNLIYNDVVRMEELEKKLPAEFVSLERLLSDSDVLSVHVPLTADNRGIIDAVALRKMKRTAILVNTSRGELVDEEALAEALTSGEIAGAGLDVLSQEPPAPGHVFYNLGERIPNLILTGHVAFGRDTVRAMFMAACDDVKRVMSGEDPKYLLNPGLTRRSA